MKNKRQDGSIRKAVSIDSNDLAAVAAQGVERALAARESLVELNTEELEAVNGGIAVARMNFHFDIQKLKFPPIVAGGIFGPIDLSKIDPLTGDMGNHTPYTR
jgi:hypothetical protein